MIIMVALPDAEVGQEAVVGQGLPNSVKWHIHFINHCIVYKILLNMDKNIIVKSAIIKYYGKQNRKNT